MRAGSSWREAALRAHRAILCASLELLRQGSNPEASVAEALRSVPEAARSAVFFRALPELLASYCYGGYALPARLALAVAVTIEQWAVPDLFSDRRTQASAFVVAALAERLGVRLSQSTRRRILNREALYVEDPVEAAESFALLAPWLIVPLKRACKREVEVLATAMTVALMNSELAKSMRLVRWLAACPCAWQERTLLGRAVDYARAMSEGEVDVDFEILLTESAIRKVGART